MGRVSGGSTQAGSRFKLAQGDGDWPWLMLTYIRSMILQRVAREESVAIMGEKGPRPLMACRTYAHRTSGRLLIFHPASRLAPRSMSLILDPALILFLLAKE